MKRTPGAVLSARALLILLAALAAFHVLVLARVLPSSAVWGGRALDPGSNVAQLEWVALVVTVLFWGIVAVRAGIAKALGLRRVSRLGTWVMFAYFVLNIVGNLASESSLEKAVFTPLSVVLAACAFVLAVTRD